MCLCLPLACEMSRLGGDCIGFGWEGAACRTKMACRHNVDVALHS